jgi:hypothetical protein
MTIPKVNIDYHLNVDYHGIRRISISICFKTSAW